MGKQRRKITRCWRKGSKKELLWGDRKIGESVCEAPFKLPAESVQLHLITWEGQQRCSFPIATFYAPIYTDQQRLIILFSFSLSSTQTHTHACMLLPFPSSPFLTLNLANKRKKKGWGDIETLLWNWCGCISLLESDTQWADKHHSREPVSLTTSMFSHLRL